MADGYDPIAAAGQGAGTRPPDRRHPEWKAHRIHWRWLVDSYEGGATYRDAVYGTDTRGMPVRNLVRHKREYPQPGDPEAQWASTSPQYRATDNDYELRRARTPVPSFVKEAVEDHLGRVFAKEVRRTGPADLERLWRDVDGLGSDMDRWMRETCGPLLYVLGCVDVLVDRPAAPDGEDVATDADVRRLGLDRAVATVILPDDVLWWRLGPGRKYEQVLIRRCEVEADGSAAEYLHLWDDATLTIYDGRGNLRSTRPHDYGVVPVVRLFDRRKARAGNVGASRMESTAEYQREYYNRDSELILSDTLQAHPLLQGPEDYVEADGTIPIGPSWLLPKKKNVVGPSVSYEGFEVVDFPKDGAESIRLNKNDLRDNADRANCIAKPAGTEAPSTVAQSGISKAFDHAALAARLSSLANTLEEAEAAVATLALAVMGTPPTPGAEEPFEVVYPTTFDVLGAAELAEGILQLQAMLGEGGHAPDVEAPLIGSYVRTLMPGRDDADYEAFDAAIGAALGEAKARRDEMNAATIDGMNADARATLQPPGGA